LDPWVHDVFDSTSALELNPEKNDLNSCIKHPSAKMKSLFTIKLSRILHGTYVVN